MTTSKAKTALPMRVKRAIEKLGADISVARRRRGITSALLAERAFVSPRTLVRAEKGDPSVSMAAYGSILFALDLTDRLASLADPAQDAVGVALEEERLPKRIRTPRGS